MGRVTTHSLWATSGCRIRQPVFMSLEGCWNAPFWAIGFPGFLDHPADRCPADAVSLGDLGEAHATVTVAENGGAIEVERGAADVAPFELGAAHAGPDPLDDQVALQLSD